MTSKNPDRFLVSDDFFGILFTNRPRDLLNNANI